MNDMKWHRRFINLAREISSYSKDPSTKVGAVVVNDLNVVVGSGYNGFPRGVEDTDDRLFNRDLKYKFMVHAEVNACIQAGDKARGSTLYIWPAFGPPSVCHDCAKVVIQSGITRVIWLAPNPEDKERAVRWQDSLSLATLMFSEADIEMLEIV